MTDLQGTLDKAREIATFLTGWTAQTQDHPNRYPQEAHVLLVSTDGLAINVWGGSDNKMSLSAENWPKDYEGHAHYPSTRINICVSSTRPVDALARDIQRRLIGPYRVAYNLMSERAENYSKFQKAQERRIKEIATIMGKRVRASGDRLHLWGYRQGENDEPSRVKVDVTVEVGGNGDTGSFKMDGVPIEHVLICLNALKGAGVLRQADPPPA